MDDDVASDDNILTNATEACIRDIHKAQLKLSRPKLYQNEPDHINNLTINRRVQMPENYNRNGKFRQRGRSQDRICDVLR